MAPAIAPSIGDGYPEYVDDEFGYTYHAWEVISAAESTRHEQIRREEKENLQALAESLAPLSDLDRWALARRHLLDAQDRDRYLKLLEPVLQGEMEHPALHYPEILVDVARRHAESGAHQDAEELLGRLLILWPQFDEILPLLRANLLLYGQRIDEADQAYQEVLAHEEEEVDLLIEAAEDFLRFGAPEVARQWLTRARQLATHIGDRSSLVDVELLAAALPPTDQPSEADGINEENQ